MADLLNISTHMDSIRTIIEKNKDYIIRARRHIHSNPEVGRCECETSKYIFEELSRAGITRIKKIGSTSLCVVFGNVGERSICFRSELDALPVEELNHHSYISNNIGIMHACGHDVHTAMLLGLALLLHDIEASLSVSVVLLFQEAEEIFPSGAPDVIKSGVLEEYNVSEIFALHVWPSLRLSEVGMKSGILMGGVAGVRVSIESSAGAAIFAAALLLLKLNDLNSTKVLSLKERTRLTIGVIEGGSLPYRDAEKALLTGSLRFLDKGALNDLLTDIRKTIRDVEGTYSANISMEIQENVRPIVYNDAQCVERVRNAVHKINGLEFVVCDQILQCSEDFGFYRNISPTCFIMVGSASDTSSTFALHDPRFNVDEDVMCIGIDLMYKILEDFSKRNF